MKNVSVELNNSGANVVVITWLPPDEPIGVIIQYQVFYAGYNGTQVHTVVVSDNASTVQ